MARGVRPQQKQNLDDPSAKPREYLEREVPDEMFDPEMLAKVGEDDSTKTINYGSIRVIGQKLLTPLEEAIGVQRARGDSVRLAFELAQLSLAFVIDENGEEHRVLTHDGSQAQLWGELHPKIRTLVMMAYGEDATPTTKASDSFLASRRRRF